MIRTQIAAVCLLVGCAASGFMGWKLRDADYQRHLRHDAAEVAQAEKETRRLEAANESLVQQVRENKAQADAKTQVVYRTIIQEVPKYVTQTQFEERVVASGGLPAGFVWNYNQGVANATAPFPSGLDPDAPPDRDWETYLGTS